MLTTDVQNWIESATLDDLQRAAEAIVQAATDTLAQTPPVPLPGAAALDVEALARNLGARDLAANLELLGSYLDHLLPRWSQKIPARTSPPSSTR